MIALLQSMQHECLSVCPCVYFVWLPICPDACLALPSHIWTGLSVCLCDCLPRCLPACACLSVCMYACLSLPSHSSTCLFICMCSYLPQCLPVRMAICLLTVYVFAHDFASLHADSSLQSLSYKCLSVCMSLCAHHIGKQANRKHITARLVPYRLKQASAAQLSPHRLHSAWIALLSQTSSFHKSCKAARVQSRVRSLSRQTTKTLAHQPMSNLKGIMSNLKGIMSNLKGTVSNLKGTVSNLKGTMSNLKGTVSNLKGIMSDLKGIMSDLKGTVSKLKGTVSDLKGTASPRLAGMPVARAKGKSLEVQVLVLVLQAFCIAQG